MKILGIDIGFGFTKATNGADTIIFKSIFGDATDLQFWMDLGQTQATEFFHVTVDGRSYFIGDLAEQQSTVLNFTLDQEKLISEFVKVLALTAAGTMQTQNCGIDVPVNIVSGLPIGYFKGFHARFPELLSGHHKVTFHKPGGGKEIKEVYINKVCMLPQPLGSILNLLMDDSGRIVNKDMIHQKIGVVDIGFRTTDFTIMDRLRYIDRGSRTTDSGIAKAFRIITNKLREKCGVSVPLFRLYRAAACGTIKMKGQRFNFTKMRDQVYHRLASNIANEIDRLWVDDWDIDVIVLTGGGSRELAAYLQPRIAGNVIPIRSGRDARLNNVEGYLKYGRHIWRESILENQPQPPATRAEPSTAESGQEEEDLPPMVDEDALEEIEALVEAAEAGKRMAG